MRRLFYGDNLDVLRRHVPDESVDLVYLDPPFNSNATYNVLFKAPDGGGSQALIEAFEDTWHWGASAELAYDEVIQGQNSDAAILLRAIRSALGENDMMAYLAMMSVRLMELHRVLKPTGSIYLHCDPTASHYLKIILDSIFGKENYLSEIIWQRTNARGTAGKWPRLHDTILFYSKGRGFTFHAQKAKANKAKMPHTLITKDGEKYQTYELTGGGLTQDGESGRPWRGHDPSKLGRHWGYSHRQLDEWDDEGLIHFPENGGFPRKRAAEPFDPDAREVTVGSVWTDIDRLNQTAKERLGYPTQKPLTLMERIIKASSNPGDVILDPFCGCGTTVHAAEKLGRSWIGIDVTHLAISLIERRLGEAFKGISFDVFGVPTDLAGARDLAVRDKHEFQKWATSRISAQPYKGGKKGMDRGIDGFLHFRDVEKVSQLGIVSVKGGENVNSGMIRDLRAVVERESAAIGVFISLVPPTREMTREAVVAGFYETGGQKIPRIQILTVEDLLSGKKVHLPFGHSEGFRKATAEKSSTAQLDLI